MKWENKLAFALLLISSSLQGQVEEYVKKLEAKYPKENFITLQETKKFKIELKNNSPKVSLESYSESILMNDFLRGIGESSVGYSKFRKLTDIEAWTMTPVKDEYKKIKVSKFETKKELDNAIFHDDQEEKVFNYTDLKRGAKRCLKTNYEFELPQMFDYVILMSQSPIEQYDVELEVDNEIAINFKEYYLEDKKFEFEKKIEKNKTIYTWRFKNLPKYKSESASCDFLYFAPHLRFLISHYLDKNKDTIKVLQTPADLYKFNYQFVANLKECSNSEYKKTIDSLVKGVDDDEIKAKKIYQWVQKNIKYIAFESGFQGYIPRDADDIFTKKYGDCKDMANIIHKSFKYAKLDSVYLTWIGSDKIPYKIEEFPCPGVFNHMIATWKHKGRTYILDATNSYTKWGLPSSFIQTKQAFIGLSPTEFEILTIAPVADEENLKEIKVKAKIAGDTLKGSGSVKLTGYLKDYFIMRTDHLKGNDRFQYLKNFVQLGNNKFILQNHKEFNIDAIDSPYIVTFDFAILNYVSKIKDEIFINPYLEKYSSTDDLNDKRISDIKMDFQSKQSIDLEIEMPTGYEVKYKPKNEFIEYDELFFTSELDVKEDKIKLYYEFVHDFIILPKSKYKTLKDYQNKVLDLLSETISFKKLN
ncbi:MAG: DUF3857 domain-containing protein [Chitinophagales bacterium]|jgi:hypothetical protein|nr:transglutaminase-like domain-containing protein [Sphingobacteriales bacterium]